MSDVADPVAAARALHAALEAGLHGDRLAELFTADATTTERPNAINPRGGTIGLAEILRGSTAGAGLLARQRYDVHDAFAHGDLAVIRLTWTGEIAADRGPFRAGQVLTAHIAQFVRVRDGRIASIETYDCYEPFDAAG
ncbi:nuclear transport factor 2 family protein [Agromyces tardus]|jgi:ketosteroid isomerase-like protein|uniref:Nuclear transport factor 2 family protein n=1 Tax=Agromyces tardus TaxID=2583849 RepID=A0A3M8AC39_9MICO|nr:nuclear transport factor 2 family protein [Agromyces tardus]RNB48800.1 nuclear transport factor 2 family protein [Agromyces tardus]